MSEFVKWSLIAFWTLGAVAVITQVGKPRKPTTGGMAATTVILVALQMVAVLTYWGGPQ